MSSNTNIRPNDIALLDVLKLLRGSVEYETRFQNLIEAIGPYVHPEFEHVEGDPLSNEALASILNQMSYLIALNASNIINTQRILAKLTFELMEQGIEVVDKELINNVKQYIK